jgi:hypothetical protein
MFFWGLRAPSARAATLRGSLRSATAALWSAVSSALRALPLRIASPPDSSIFSIYLFNFISIIFYFSFVDV